jgi:hypothetical protein
MRCLSRTVYDMLKVALRIMAIFAVPAFICALAIMAFGRDRDGSHAQANPELHAWFNQLASGKGLCCSFADGQRVEDVDWDTGGDNKDTQSEGGHYRVRLNGKWIDIPDAAVVTEPNKFGPAVVWPYTDGSGQTQIRCFMPGVMM